MKLTRRDFIQKTAIGTVSAIAVPRAWAATSEPSIEILLNEPIGTISPDLYGHFTEHIGGVIYDGIWVGEDSKIPNEQGIRTDLVKSMRRIKPSVVRWPGGCFADSYNWRDGVGSRAQRPRRTNFWINDSFLQHAPDGPAKYDPNEFGTNEFMHFCRLIGAEPYLAVNLRGNSARDFDEWVEYCNAPAGLTTLSAQRATNGDSDPFRVRFWGIGNESWGCGGNFTPEEYATEFRRFTAWVPNYGVPLALIGSGPNGGDVDWTRRFFSKLTERDRGLLNTLHGWAMHYYCGTAGKGDAIDFTTADWYELLGKATQMENLIKRHWDAMGEIDKEHRVKLIVDEWGAWHRPGTEVARAHLFGQTSTMRDALIAGLTLDIFNRHADKVVMANVAQLINNLHSLFLATGDKFVATPNFHVFEMYAAHHHGKSVRAAFNVDQLSTSSKEPVLPGLAGSASLHDRRVVLTVVNPSVEAAVEVKVSVPAAKLKAASGQVLACSDIHAHNSFEQPNVVQPRGIETTMREGQLFHSFPSASVTCLQLELE
ncbi:MAG TPA: alpha-L-arabinofuranosidase C-terminal domain-containing protein [Candidatus Limnocylindrales bacterium]|jgi:alpha-N-arabinofuranosidase|nr:alpha-L-arabinofuranosidase C-terminal domain-containing protein [Candidatus Limnocylindrales bacterium]